MPPFSSVSSSVDLLRSSSRDIMACELLRSCSSAAYLSRPIRSLHGQGRPVCRCPRPSSSAACRTCRRIQGSASSCRYCLSSGRIGVRPHGTRSDAGKSSRMERAASSFSRSGGRTGRPCRPAARSPQVRASSCSRPMSRPRRALQSPATFSLNQSRQAVDIQRIAGQPVDGGEMPLVGQGGSPAPRTP